MATTITQQGFDETYYLQAKAAQMGGVSVAQCLAAITAAGLTPEQHYYLYGYNEGLSPNAYFNANQYATSKAAAMGGGYTAAQFQVDWYNASGSTNLYLHYLQYGAFESGVNPSSGFDDQAYYAAKAAKMGGGTTPAQAEAAIKAAGLTAISHYLLYGVSESLSYTPTTGGNTGQTYTLTTAMDILTGTPGNDTFYGSDTTYTSGDSLTGNGGTDTLSLTFAGANTAIATLNGVDKVKIQDFSSVAVDGTLWNGVKDIEFANSTKATTVNNLSTIPTTVTVNKIANNATVTMTAAAVAGSSDSATVIFNGVTDNTKILTMNGVETINFQATGADSKFQFADVGLKTVTVSGNKTLDLSAAVLATTVKTVDASAMTAGGFLTDLTGATLTSFKGGAGNDTLLLSATAVGTTVIDGGDGIDTIGLNVLNVPGFLATTSKVTNVETLKVQNAVTVAAANNWDLSKVSGLQNVTFDALFTSDAAGTGTKVQTISGLTTGSTIRFNNSTLDTNTGSGTSFNAGLVLTGSGFAAGTSDTVNFVMAKGASGFVAETFTGATLNNVENVTFDVKSLTGATTTLTGLADPQMTSLTISSSAVDGTGTATDAADLTTGTGFTSTVLGTVDLSGYRAAATGVVNISSLSTSMIATGATITGPSKGILIATGGAGADHISTGAGGSNSGTGITGGAGADQINLSASTAKADILTWAAASDSNELIYDSVTGFTNAVSTGDKIDFFGGNTVNADVAAGTATGVTNLTAAVTSGIMTFGGSAASTATLADKITAAQTIGNAVALRSLAFVDNGNTYVFSSGATIATTDDMLVKLVGVSDATSLSAVASAANTIYIA